MAKCLVCSLPVQVYEGTYVCANGHTRSIATDDTNKKSISSFTRNISIKKTKLFPDQNFTDLSFFEQFYTLYNSLAYRIFRSYYESKDYILDGFLMILASSIKLGGKKNVESYEVIIKIINMALYCAIRFMRETSKSPHDNILRTHTLDLYILSIQRGSKHEVYTLYEHNSAMSKIKAAKYIRDWYSKLTGLPEYKYKAGAYCGPREFKSITPYDFSHLMTKTYIKRLRFKFTYEDSLPLHYYDKIIDEYKFLDILLPVSPLQLKAQYLFTVKIYRKKNLLLHHDFTVFCYILLLYRYKNVDINFTLLKSKHPIPTQSLSEVTYNFHLVSRLFKFETLGDFTQMAYPIFQAYYKVEKI